MKACTFLAATCLAHAGLSFAIPAQHGHQHNDKRGAAAVVVTETTTFYQTVVWVDKNGKPVSTQVNDAPVGAIKPSSTPAASTAATSSLNVAAVFGSAKRPSHGPQTAPSHPSAIPSSVPSPPQSSPTSAPASSAAPMSTPDKGTGSTGSQGSANVVPGGMGICYDMIATGGCKTSDTINADFGFLRSQGFAMVRVYDIGCPVGDFVAAAANQGMKIMVGINSINMGDMNTLIGMVNGNWAPVDTVYVGNERVNGNANNPADVAAAVTTARGILAGAGYHGNVVTVDTFNAIQSNPTLISTSDYVCANAHAFFDPTGAAAQAATFVMNAYKAVKGVAGGKRVVISETGWPWQGPCNGNACPSVANQQTAMNGIMSEFASMAGNLFLFQGYDASYKDPGPYGVEQFFGIFDSDHYQQGSIHP